MEERIREITLEHLLPALESGSFDFIADFAGKVPMDVISELVGVPRGRPGRAATPGRPGAPPRRRRLRRAGRRDGGRAQPGRLLPGHGRPAAAVAHRRPDLRPARRRDRRRQADRRGGRGLPLPHGGGRQRDDHQAARQRLVLGMAEPRRTGQAVRRSDPGAPVGGGDAALRHLEPDAAAGPPPTHRDPGHDHPRRRPGPAPGRIGQPGRAGLPRPRPLRPRPRHQGPRQLRQRAPLLHGGPAGPPRGPDRPERAGVPGGRLRRRPGRHRAGPLDQRAGSRRPAHHGDRCR